MPEEASAAKPEEKKEERYPLATDKEPVVTQHQLGDLKYTATTGMIPLNDEFGETDATPKLEPFRVRRCDGQSLGGNVVEYCLGLRVFGRERESDRTRTGADIEDDRLVIPAQVGIQNRLYEKFGFGSRNKNVFRDEEDASIKTLLADDLGEGDVTRAFRHHRRVRFCKRCRYGRIVMREQPSEVALQEVRQERLGFKARFENASALQSARGGGDEIA